MIILNRLRRKGTLNVSTIIMHGKIHQRFMEVGWVESNTLGFAEERKDREGKGDTVGR